MILARRWIVLGTGGCFVLFSFDFVYSAGEKSMLLSPC